MKGQYDFSGGERGRYADRLRDGGVMVVLDPDVAAVFPTGADVNRALRAILQAIPKRPTRRQAAKKRAQTD